MNYLEINPQALLEICQAVELVTRKYHGHANGRTCADLAVAASVMILLSSAEGGRTTETLDEFEAGIHRVIGGFRNGTWLTDDPVVAGFPAHNMKGSA